MGLKRRELPVPVEVESSTGEWSVDGMPMILVPRHFLVNNHNAVEEALGYRESVELYRDPGVRSAREWCEREAQTHGLHGHEIFRHYMDRLSRRGWAQFTVQELNTTTVYARVQVANSVFVAEQRSTTECPVCYMFEGWIEGALGYVSTGEHGNGEVRCREIQCAALGEDHCLFEAKLE